MSLTFIIIGVTVAVSFFAWNNQDLMHKLILNPYIIHRRGEWYRMLTSGFLHADYQHLFFNMISLYFLGGTVEKIFNYVYGQRGDIFFILLYVSGIVVANIPDTRSKKDISGYNALGASGGVSAIVFAFIILAPLQKLSVLFIPIGIPAWIFGILYIWYSNYMEKQQMDNVGHQAHLWGGLWGFAFVVLTYPDSFQLFIQKIMGSF